MEQLNQRFKILHVNDDRDFLDLFTLTFEPWFDIHSAAGGSEAISLLKENSFDAVITDYNMPEMDGLELLKKLQQDFSSIPVIFYTGLGDEKVAREAFISGVSDYLVMDFSEFTNNEKVINSITKAIERRKTEDALRESKSLLNSVFRLMNEVFLHADNNGNIIQISPSASKVFHTSSEEEFINWNLLDLCAEPDECSAMLKDIEQVGEVWAYPLKLKYMDDGEFKVNVNAVKVKNPDGTHDGIDAILSPVS